MSDKTGIERSNLLKGVVMAAAEPAARPAKAADQSLPNEVGRDAKSPYGGFPSGGLTLPLRSAWATVRRS